MLDERTHTVSVSADEITLTPIEFDLLAVLMRSPGRVFSRTELEIITIRLYGWKPARMYISATYG